MRQRKKELLHSDKYSVFKCNNIKLCRVKMREINNMRTSKEEKKQEMEKWQRFYLAKSTRFIQKYFDLLEDENYNEAFAFLRITTPGNKYFHKQRLDTFYVNSNKMIGHLQIFIDIYQFIYKMIERYNTLKNEI